MRIAECRMQNPNSTIRNPQWKSLLRRVQVCNFFLVPTLCVGMNCVEALPPVQDSGRWCVWNSRGLRLWTLERPVGHSHAERGNEKTRNEAR